jgi:hypothetical protein
MEWVAYCKTCNEELDRAANGSFVEAAAYRHLHETNGHHDVIVGYDLSLGQSVQSDGAPEDGSQWGMNK